MLSAVREVGAAGLTIALVFAVVVGSAKFIGRPRKAPRVFADQLTAQRVANAGLKPRDVVAVLVGGNHWKEGSARCATLNGVKVRYRKVKRGVRLLGVEVYPSVTHPVFGKVSR